MYCIAGNFRDRKFRGIAAFCESFFRELRVYAWIIWYA